MTSLNIDTDYYLKQEVNVDVFMDAGSGNYDFACNVPYHGYYGTKWEPICDIAWLAKQQGYKARQTSRALKTRDYEGSTFLKSVREEIDNTCYQCNCLIFMPTMTVGQYFKVCQLLKEEEKLNNSYYLPERCGRSYIKLSSTTPCGLINPWNGSGSILDIKLDDDVKLPTSVIWKVCLDDYKEKYFYKVREIYGGRYHDGELLEIVKKKPSNKKSKPMKRKDV
jgi:hypothetical protein